MSEASTNDLIDEAIKCHGDERGAIAFLLGSNDSSERLANKLREVLRQEPRKTTIEWLSERIAKVEGNQ